MKVQHIIGADLSKRTIDLFFKSHLHIENNKAGFKRRINWIKEQNINISEMMVVMEHTGLYSYCFEKFLHDHHIAFCKVNAYLGKRVPLVLLVANLIRSMLEGWLTMALKKERH